jgi:hypothetical protein
VPILHGKAGFSEAYQRYAICKEFGWDYYTYESQPAWFIQEINLIQNQEAEKIKSEVKSQQTKIKK